MPYSCNDMSVHCVPFEAPCFCTSVPYVATHEGTVCAEVAPEHPSFEAVVGNYVFIHNAFRNHLEYIVALAQLGGRRGKVASELRKWWTIMEVHSRVEDELFMPALEGRGFQASERIHQGHVNMKEAVDRALEEVSGPAPPTKAAEAAKNGGQQQKKRGILQALLELRKTLLRHLEEEELEIMPAMVEHFSAEELWALDSLIAHPELDYCGKGMLLKIVFWWFGNVTKKERKALWKHFRVAGGAEKLSDEQWGDLICEIPALQGRNLIKGLPRGKSLGKSLSRDLSRDLSRSLSILLPKALSREDVLGDELAP